MTNIEYIGEDDTANVFLWSDSITNKTKVPKIWGTAEVRQEDLQMTNNKIRIFGNDNTKKRQ